MIYIILYLLLVICVFMIGRSKTNIHFYGKSDANKLFDSDEYRLFETLYRKDEIFYKTRSVIDGDIKKLKKVYLDNVIDISDSHRDMLTKMCEKADVILMDTFGVTIYWRLVCMRGELDWGFPYTLDDAIVLCEEELDDWARRDFSFGLSYIVHEAVHILQKGVLKDNFEKLYRDMGFVKVNVRDKLLKNKEINKNWITNPDGLSGDWVYRTPEGYICPVLLLDANGRHVTKYVKLDGNFDIKDRIYGLDEVRHLYNFRGDMVGQVDHPNEIFGSYMESVIYKK